MVPRASLRWQGMFFAVICLSSTGGSGHAAQTKSADYSLDYAVTSSSGANSTTGPYEVLSRVTVTGFAAVPASSSSYSITSLGATSADATTVADWVLY